MHVQVVRNDIPAPVVQNVQESAFDADAIGAFATGEGAEPAPVQQTQKTVVKDANDWSATPRNAPCPCGSGKKYKMCHGRN
ncbi:MAG: SEC-C metal-binding domain-containing protein [Actinomycetota bacterium]